MIMTFTLCSWTNCVTDIRKLSHINITPPSWVWCSRVCDLSLQYLDLDKQVTCLHDLPSFFFLFYRSLMNSLLGIPTFTLCSWTNCVTDIRKLSHVNITPPTWVWCSRVCDLSLQYLDLDKQVTCLHDLPSFFFLSITHELIVGYS